MVWFIAVTTVITCTLYINLLIAYVVIVIAIFARWAICAKQVFSIFLILFTAPMHVRKEKLLIVDAAGVLNISTLELARYLHSAG